MLDHVIDSRELTSREGVALCLHGCDILTPSSTLPPSSAWYIGIHIIQGAVCHWVEGVYTHSSYNERGDS